MQVYSILGWVNVFLAAVNAFLFFIRLIYKIKQKSFSTDFKKKFQTVLKFFSKIHRFSGASLLLLGAVHGYLALRSIYWHTGLMLWLIILVLFGFYILGTFRFFKKYWLVCHKILDVIFWFFLILHLVNPWLF